ncbi:MAG: hypothetical protein L0215_19120 [Gemmataceae bacterium]|nr:hypothetical protein [Gemmataceae bacterium]
MFLNANRQAFALVAVSLSVIFASASPAPAQRFLGYTHDKSSFSVIHVQSTTGWVPVRHGETKTIRVPSHRFSWLSGSSVEWTTAPWFTNLVVVSRSFGRDINWACYHEPAAAPAQVFLGRTIDRSSAHMIYVGSTDGWVPVRQGETKTIRVPSNRFLWYSDGSREWTTAPPGTNLVVVTRDSSRAILWDCYRDNGPRITLVP